jgi:hypothetical protein
MPLFLVTCVCDEGVYETSFRVVEAPSRLAVAESMVNDPYRWDDFLDRSRFWEQVRDRWWSAEEFLQRLAGSHVDGDSRYQLAIHEVAKVEPYEPRVTPGPYPMSYNEFNLERLRGDFSLTMNDQKDLFGPVAAVAVSPALRSLLDETVPLAVDVHTEKARSELIVAPILLEVRRLSGRRIGLFPGIEFKVAPEKGLTGYCDYILSRSSLQLVLTAPVMAIVEAKNEDMKLGMGQCAAEMVAARLFNERKGQGPTTIHGAVTTGTNWRFLKLEEDTLFVDRSEYFLEPVGKILSILLHCAGYGLATEAQPPGTE